MKKRIGDHLGYLSIFSLLLVLTSGLPCANADTVSQTALSNVALFNRCYSHLTRTRVPKTQALFAQVKAGTLDPITACIQVLEEAMFQTSGVNAGSLPIQSQSSTEVKNVLATFNDFHRTWFPSDNFSLATINGGPVREGWIMDSGEPALHITRALFQSGVNYSAVVTTDPVMEAMRTGPVAQPADLMGIGSNYAVPYDGQNARMVTNTGTQVPSSIDGTALSLTDEMITVPGVQYGDLIGIRPITAATNAAKYAASVTSTSWNNTASPINQTRGAGIIGSPSYMILNNGRYDGNPMDGGLRMPRRWSQHVYQDLLCRSLPVLRASDAQLYVETTTTAQTPPFRVAASCMQCHAGMDPMAASVRDISYSMSTYGDESDGLELPAKIGNASFPSETGFVDSDPNYANRPAKGRLTFRSYDGTLVNIPVLGLSGAGGLGAALATTNDLYACAAKRYFYYFTGITANLQDIGDPQNLPLTADDLYYRNLVIAWGQQLKQNQNLESLIRSILSSDIYKNPALKAVGK